MPVPELPPNVLVIVLDDVGVDQISAYGWNGAPPTPNIDGLAARGLRFQHAWSMPVCSPSRAAILSGQMPHRNQIGAVIHAHQDAELPLSVVTLPEMLRTADADWHSAAIGKWPVKPRIVTTEAEKYSAFRRARAALAASGTVTLELALAHVPMVASYRVSAWEGAIVRMLLQANSAILPNIVLNENVVPELLQENSTAENLASALLPLLSDSPERKRQLEAFTRLDEILGTDGEAASDKAARIVMEVYDIKRK